MEQRVVKLQKKLQAEGLDAMLVTEPKNRFYLSGFTGTSAMLCITADRAVLLTDFRYVDQAKAQAKHMEVVRHGQKPLQQLAGLLADKQVRSLAFEQEEVTYGRYLQLKKELDVELEPVKEWIETFRLIKDAAEVSAIRRAAAASDRAFRHICGFIRAGLSERLVGLELEIIMRRQGAWAAAFDTIVASGHRGALPHGVASDKELEPGDLVTMDFGAVMSGYNSDITRTVAVGAVDRRMREIYEIVLEAQLAGLDCIAPGVTGAEADAAARRVINGYGYGDYFGHGLGHGVGVGVHEGPRLAPGAEEALKPGMVVTVEPGIYLPEKGGVRIEDMVLVTERGCEVLTGSTKDLLLL